MTQAVQPVIDWQANKSIVECNRHMFTNKVSTDVTFLVGPERNVHQVHKYILISRSTVFYEMFEGPLSENTAREIELPDVESRTFDAFLLYLYCDEIKVDLDNVLSLLYVARKYMVTSLVNRCLNKLKTNMVAENVCSVMECAHIYGDDQLRKKCYEFILRDPNLVFKSQDISKLCTDCLTSLLKDENLAMNEEDIFKSMILYAQVRCRDENHQQTSENWKMLLGEAINHVRFPLMSAEFLLEHVEPREILSTAEILKLTKYAMKKAGDCLHFNNTPRKCRFVVTRFTGFGDIWSYQRDKKDVITFKCSEDVFILGIQMYGSCQAEAEYNVNVKLLQLPYNVPIGQKHLIIQTDGAQKIYHVTFDKPIKVEKDGTFAISLTMKGPETHSGSGGQVEIEKEGVTFTFMQNKDSTNNTNPSHGQIPGIIFEKIPQQ